MCVAACCEGQGEESACFVQWEVSWHVSYNCLLNWLLHTVQKVWVQRGQRTWARQQQQNWWRSEKWIKMKEVKVKWLKLMECHCQHKKGEDPTEHQVLHGRNILKHMRILGAKHGNMEDKLFEWFCHAWENRLPVDGQMVKVKADETVLKMGMNFKCSNRWTQHLKERGNIMALSKWRRDCSRPGFSREVTRKCETNHHQVCSEGHF